MKHNFARRDNKISTAKELTVMGLLIALTTMATMFFKVPTHIGYTHLGDAMVFIAAILLGKKRGMVVAALGMCLADLLGGYFIWAPITFSIKGIMALITAAIAYRGNYEGKSIINNIFACILGGIWMIVAYYLANILLTMYVYTKDATFIQSVVVAFYDSLIPNIIEVLIGIIIAVPIIKVLNNKQIYIINK